MTLFWWLAGCLALGALLFVALPAWRRAEGYKDHERVWLLAGSGVALALGAVLYLKLSNWDWQDTDPKIQQLIEQLATLRRATDRAPENTQAWLDLGAAYLRFEQYAAAERCFERANRLSNQRNPDALAGLAESKLLASAALRENGDDTGASAATGASALARAAELFEQTLKIDPANGRALFYSAMLAGQRGDFPLARQRLSTMRANGVPPEVAAALDRQIAAIDEQMKTSGNAQPGVAGAGASPAVVRPGPGTGAGSGAGTGAAVDAATAIRLSIRVSESVRAKVPANASLFVFVRGAAGGPPLAVKRLVTALPVDVVLSKTDSMLAGNALQPGQKVAVVARVSAAGTPMAQSGDPFGELQTTAGAAGAQSLVIDRLSP